MTTLTGLKDTTYIRPQLSEAATIWTVSAFEEIFSPSDPLHPFYQYHDKPFDKSRYAYSGTLPVHIGAFPISIPSTVPNILRCPIKINTDRRIVLPSEINFLKDFVEFCCIYETSFNPNFEKTFAHITVDHANLQPGMHQRVPGWHVDGFQGSKFPVKHNIEHSYLWSSCCGTEFCPQPFFIKHLDESKYLVFDEFNKQAHECNVFTCLPENIYLFSPYDIHRSPRITKPVSRLLVRVTFEYQKLLDPNNTVNPNLPITHPYKYDVRNRLGTYNYDVNYEEYGWIYGNDLLA